MMEVREFFNELGRMCQSYDGNCDAGCEIEARALYCPVCSPTGMEQVCDIVENWVKEHPPVTRQSEFLEQHPNSKLGKDGVIFLCPQDVDTTVECNLDRSNCPECRQKYWNEAVK